MLWLNRVSGIGINKAFELVEIFGTAKKIYHSDNSLLYRCPMLNKTDIDNIIKCKNYDNIENLINELNKKDIKFVTIYEDNYPYYLKSINNPPMILYYRGQLIDFENELPISIIGARNCTSYGRNVTEKLTRDLVYNGCVIISGMARGIDTYAHQSALDSNGKTVAVLGSGLDICYPPENDKLMNSIIRNGCIISEFPPGTKPYKQNFPMRNRIIAGLTRGVVVIEARKRSGTLTTVNFATEEGRDVYCVPGNITSNLSEGTNELISEGAICVTNAKSILTHYDLALKNYKQKETEKNVQGLSDEEILIYNKINEQVSVNFDILNSFALVEESYLMYLLTVLEIKGYILKTAGNNYSIKNK